MPLGYSNWDAYCKAEFPTSRLRLPREERAEVVASLRESGLSIRAIEAATGVSRKTVIKDFNKVVEFPPPDSDQVDAAGGLTEDSPGQTDRVRQALDRARSQTTIGIDNKRYRRNPPPQEPTKSDSGRQKPRRGPLTDTAVGVGLDLGRINRRLVKLLDDDRFDRNKEMIGNRIRPEVKFGLDVLGRIDRKINKHTDKVEDEVTDTIEDVTQYAETLMAAFKQTFAPHRLQQLHASDRREFLLAMRGTIKELEKLEGGDHGLIEKWGAQ
jgi:hypothetical protein